MLQLPTLAAVDAPDNIATTASPVCGMPASDRTFRISVAMFGESAIRLTLFGSVKAGL